MWHDLVIIGCAGAFSYRQIKGLQRIDAALTRMLARESR